MGSSALAQRLVASFIARVQDEAPELQRLLEAGQIEALARKAHQLRGSAANISAPRLTGIFDSLERLANESQTAELPRCLNELPSELKRFIAHCGALQWENGTPTLCK
jgi:HPt (histidine-containing phosphotransfer) domain-containing protein